MTTDATRSPAPQSRVINAKIPPPLSEDCTYALGDYFGARRACSTAPTTVSSSVQRRRAG